MQQFNVLNLPSVALREVWRCLNPFELFEISQCSKRCLETIALAGTRKFKFELDINQFIVSINNSWNFIVKDHRNIQEHTVEGNRKFGSHSFAVSIEQPTKIRFFSGNLESDFLAVFLHLSGLFKCPTHSVFACFPRDIYMSAIKYVCSQQKTISNLDIMIGSDKDVDFILNNLEVTESLRIAVDKLPVNYVLPCQIVCKSFRTFFSFFITLDDILSMKESVDIQIHSSSLTNQDIEVLFQHWISGNLPKLEYLHIDGEKFTKNMKIGDLKTLWGPSRRVIVRKIICGENRAVYAAVPLQRNDGIVAMFHFEPAQDDSPAFISLLLP
uniref:F-box domain-containing protein n=1 Tax=Caenorhabditis tropicalis TaxID=1561998 RepID=A0A1I7U7X9_9PELO